MVGADGRLPLPWLEPLLQPLVARQQAHALLLHGQEGVGQFELGLALAQAWLCEAPGGVPDPRPCGRCASCRLVQAHSHPDLLVLLPEALREPLGWNDGAEDDGGERASKAKPSKEIKVEAVRRAVGFAQTTSARGLAKVVVIHPAERMNGVSANTLLKTLEEPPGQARFVLSSTAPDALLPTIRSRCQAVALALPPPAVAAAWLAGQGIADAETLLAAAGGQPQAALDGAKQGVDAAFWRRLPTALATGEAAAMFAGWSLPRVVDALQKLCHDLACARVGAAPRYFPAASLRPVEGAAALQRWTAELTRVARHAEHPWSAALMIDALVAQGQRVLNAPSSRFTAESRRDR